MTSWRDHLKGAGTPAELTTREDKIKAAVNKIRAANTSPEKLEQTFYDGLAKIFDEWLGIRKSREEESAEQKQARKDAELQAELNALIKEGKAPFRWGQEIEKFDNNGNPIYKPNTGYEVNDLASYKRYLKDLENLYEFDLAIPPYRFPNGREVWTYEQFRLVALNTYPSDYLKGDKLTYLTTFVEELFKKEPIGQIARHLRELFSDMEFKLKLAGSQGKLFWESIEKYLKKAEVIPPPPELPQDIKAWIERVDSFIDFTYSAFPKPYNYQLYLSDKLAILNDLEILLREVYQKWLANPQNYLKMINNKLFTVMTTTHQWGENTSRQRGTDRQALKEKIDEMDNLEQPLKTYTAENNKEWERFKALVFKNQGRENIKDKTTFDKLVDKESGGKKGSRGETRTISKDVDPRVESRLLHVISMIVDKFMIYKDIRSILDKHYWTLGEPLFRNREEYVEEDWREEI
jgi:hypothetical protein